MITTYPFFVTCICGQRRHHQRRWKGFLRVKDWLADKDTQTVVRTYLGDGRFMGERWATKETAGRRGGGLTYPRDCSGCQRRDSESGAQPPNRKLYPDRTGGCVRARGAG